jgi:hypothetical protein
MSQEELPGNDKRPGAGKVAPPGQEAGTDTGSYAHQDLVALMRRRREAEEKLRQRQAEAAADRETAPEADR